MSNSIYCHENLYLVPSCSINEIVMSTTKSYLGGLMYTAEGVLALCATSVDIFCNTLGIPSVLPIQSQLKTSERILWFNDFMKSNTFVLCECEPCQQFIDVYHVNAGEVVNPNSTLPPISFNYPGTVTKYYLDNTLITFFRQDSDEGAPDLPLNVCASGFLKYDSSTQVSPRSYIYQIPSTAVNLHPQENEINTSSSCTQCTTCSECLWCNMCLIFFGLALASNAVTTNGCASTAIGCGL